MKTNGQLKMVRILMYRTMTDACIRSVDDGVEDWNLSNMFFRLYRRLKGYQHGI